MAAAYRKTPARRKRRAGEGGTDGPTRALPGVWPGLAYYLWMTLRDTGALFDSGYLSIAVSAILIELCRLRRDEIGRPGRPHRYRAGHVDTG
jgi:hypothetical protein